MGKGSFILVDQCIPVKGHVQGKESGSAYKNTEGQHNQNYGSSLCLGAFSGGTRGLKKCKILGASSRPGELVGFVHRNQNPGSNWNHGPGHKLEGIATGHGNLEQKRRK